MAYLDRELGTWRAKDGTGGFTSQAEAEEYEDSGVRNPTNDTSGFGDVYNTISLQPSNAAQVQQQGIRDTRQQQIIDDQQHNLRVQHFNDGSVGSFSESVQGNGYQEGKGFVDAPKKTAGEHFADLGRLGLYGLSAGANPVGTALGGYLPKEAQLAINPLGTLTDEAYQMGGGLLPGGNGRGNYQTGGPASTGGPVSPGTDGIRVPPRNSGVVGGPGAGAPGGPAGQYTDAIAEDEAQRDGDKQSLSDLYEQARFDGSEESKQSRDQQQQALSKQAELYNMLSQFDPDAYAQRASELALKNQLALAKSIPGGAAAGADGMFAALEAAPGINAEAQRDGQSQLLQRQQLAAQVTGQMGDLASTTRGQDVGEDQLKSEFGVRIADGVSQITGLDWQLDSGESKTLANIALALDQQNIDWARLDLDGQIAEADRILAEAGLAQQWRIFKAGTELSEKDLYGGLLTLLGTGMGGLFQIQAAKAGK